MVNMVRQQTEFGKDLRLVGEVTVTGQKVGADKDFWAKLAHDEQLFARTVAFVNNGGVIKPQLGSAEDQIAIWAVAYTHVGINIDPTDVEVPAKQEGFDRLIVVPQKMMPQKAFDLCENLMHVWKFDDNESLDDLDKHPRNNPYKGYAVWCRETVEADEQHKRKSYNLLQAENVNFLNLTERLLYSWKYFQETGKHLDIKRSTLTSSVRSSGGTFGVSYSDDKLRVGYYDLVHCHDSLRAREAVS